MVKAAFYVPEALLDAVKDVAKREGITVSEAIRHALYFFLLNHRSLMPPPPLQSSQRPIPPRHRRTIVMSVTVTPHLMTRLDQLIQAGYFHSRAEAVRIALELLLRQLEAKQATTVMEVGYR